jgi:hypothetical protein
MSDDQRWRDAMGEMMAIDRYAPADFAAPQPQGADVRLPDLSLQSLGPGNPRLDAGYGYGGLEARGSYQRSNPNAPANWRATLGYRRQF